MRTKTTILTLLWAAFLITGCATQPGKPEPAAPAVKVFKSGWPSFSFSYPADWKNTYKLVQGEVFRANAAEGRPNVTVAVNANMPSPVKFFKRSIFPILSSSGGEFDVVKDQAVALKSGNEAWETELNWVLNDGTALTTLFVTVKKENIWVTVSVSDAKGKMTDDLRGVAYSLDVDHEEMAPVALQDDVQQFFDETAKDIISHDMEKVQARYSDQYLKNGRTKTDVIDFYKSVLNMIPDYKYVITKFDRQADKVSFAGYAIVMGNRYPITGDVIALNEDKKWVFYGNQQ